MKIANTLSSYQLKIVGLIFMLIDHIHTYLHIGPVWTGAITRFVAPLFLFFIVEGFMHTSSRKRYFLRTFGFAMLTLMGNVTINIVFHNVDYLTGEMDFYSLIAGNNILLTYAIFLLILKCLEEFKEQANFLRFGWLFVGVLLSMITIPFCEGALQLLPLLYIFYFCYGNKPKIIFGTLLYSFLWLVNALYNYLAYGIEVGLLPSLLYDCEFMMCLVCLAIISYDGTKGKNSMFGKWSFYVIYPFHIWLLRILSLA